jgi:recombinational DNA repair protein (RecF pathway)
MVVAFSREHGLLRGVAKGARRLGSNYAGGFEALTLGDIVFSNAAWEKAARASEGGGLVTITAWEVLELFPAGRESLRSFLACCCMLDLVQRGMQEADPHEGVFDALVRALRAMGGATTSAPHDAAKASTQEDACEPEHALASFAWTLLHETGLAPDVTSDIITGEALAPAKVFAFLPRLGGFASESHVQREAPPRSDEKLAAQGPAWRVRSETLLALRSLASPGLAIAAQAKASRATSNAQTQLLWQRTASLLVQYFREVHQTDVPAVGQWLDATRSA